LRVVRRSEQWQVLVVAVAEHEREHAGLGLVEVEDLAHEQRPERADARPHVGPDLPRQRQDLGRVAPGLEGEPHRLDAGRDGLVGGIAGGADAGQVALDVDREHRDTHRGQLSRHELEGLGLAGAGGAGDQPVTVHPGQRQRHADVVQEVLAQHRRAQHEDRLVERVAGRHLAAERVVHLVLPCPGAPRNAPGADAYLRTGPRA
jgi:hypothetical protein